MDWDSPTTKKHVAEANAQGCELLGEGRDYNYRLYRLPCGHVRELALSNVRQGKVGCPTCLDKKVHEEAKSQGCKLLGLGKNKTYRTYRLPCGHEREVLVARMRVGDFRCEQCTGEKFRREAAKQGCILLGPGKTAHHRIYGLPCGHEQDIQVSSMRRGSFRCQTCLDKRLHEEARSQGCELLGPGSGKTYRTYRLSCGHVLEIGTGAMRRGSFRCQPCLDRKLEKEAGEHGCHLIGAGRDANYRIYGLPCGHEKEVNVSQMRLGNFRCQTCFDRLLQDEAQVHGCEVLAEGKDGNYRIYCLSCGHRQEVAISAMRQGGFHCQTCLKEKWRQEAEAQGCCLLGSGKDYRYRRYRLACGHEQDIQVGGMRTGNYRCQTCEDYYYTQPSDVYLLLIRAGADQWLKLGFSKNIEYRTTQYGLPTDAGVSLLASLSFETGMEAVKFEKSLHTKYRRKLLRAKDMAEFHMKGGQTECYPVKMAETLLAEFKAAQ